MADLLKKFTSVFGALTCSLLLTFITPLGVYAAAANPAPAARVSFTFDDGYDSTSTQVAPTLAKYGFSGTVYVSTGCVGMTKAPNTCHANTDAKYITWNQLTQLKNQYGWEIGSHTVSHPYLASFDASDGQPDKLSIEQVRQELSVSKATLAAHGFDARSFATPYGDYDMPVLAEIAKQYETHRGFADTGYNSWPNSEYILRVQQVQAGVSVAQVKSYIDTAAANNEWLVLVFHDVKNRASNDPDDYEYRTRDLDQIAAYVKARNIPVVNPGDAIAKSDVNLLANGSFNNGLADGWSTDAPTAITADSGNNGSYPDPLKAVKFAATSKDAHLFSPQVSVEANTTYLLKNFINVQQLKSGELGFYIDEYDANGNWISGQWKGAESSVFVENYNFTYKPSSQAVATASLQVYATGNSGIVAYLDNVQWFPLSTATPPAYTNLVPNSNFDNGLADGWSTDSPANITTDNNNNGSPANPASSIKFISSTRHIHLFSPAVNVDAAKTYNITSYANIVQRTSGELGFYIDEYDANGNWISGQWKGARYTASAADSTFGYTPTSSNVHKAALQVYVTDNSGIVAYVDHVRWIEL